jgi:hypothetical protein
VQIRFAEEDQRHALRMSRLNGELLAWVERHPEWLDRAHFREMDRHYEFAFASWQAWPTFVDAGRVADFERVAVGVSRLPRSVFERVFDLNPARMARFYGIDESLVKLLVGLFESSDVLDNLLARGDFIDSAAGGLRCIEVNGTGILGGWEPAYHAERYLRIPLVARFLASCAAKVKARDSLRTLFEHAVHRTLGLMDHGERELRLARLFAGRQSVHALFELLKGDVPAPVLRAWLERRLEVYNGPLTPLLRDKRNLALVSEHADGDLFTAEERALIAAHVPWTRHFGLEQADFEGERVRLADFVVENRRRLVLKPADLSSGRDVWIGRFASAERWRHQVDRAAREGRWVVQEYVEPAPGFYQMGDYGYGLHDVVRGVLSFGHSYGGGFLRVVPQDRADGVINRKLGAADGLILEVEAGPPARLAEGETVAASAACEPAASGAPAAAESVVEISAESKDVHGRLGALNREFLERVEQRPSYLRRSSFEVLERNREILRYRLQSWPTFLDDAALREIDRVNGGLVELVKSVPRRFLGNDAKRIEEHYGYEPEVARLMASLLERPEHLAGLLARGDFIWTRDGLQCLEVNMVSSLGGWGSAVWADLYLQTPPVREFVREAGVGITFTNTAQVCFGHLTAAARAGGLGRDGEVHLAFAVPEDHMPTHNAVDFLHREHAAYLRHTEGRGSVSICTCDELEDRGDGLYLGDRRIHAVNEHYLGGIPRHVLFAWLEGRVVLYNGPVSHVFDDRRNLALLSQFQDSEYFTAEERRLIRGHLPWTRFLTHGFTSYGAERVGLPDFAVDNRDRMVIKHVNSGRGEKVVLGIATPQDAWERTLEAAADEGAWIVQERVDSLPFLYQIGEAGCVPQDVVWGIFRIGSRYGGGFLRMMPRGQHGVINAARGADEGVLFEVVRGEDDPSRG